MDDDFNSAVALSNLHTVFKYINNIMRTTNKSNKQIVANTMKKILEDLKSTYRILGLLQQRPEDFITEIRNKYLNKLNIDTSQIETQISKRTEAKKIRDFETADAIRAELEKFGIILKDTKDGTAWEFKELFKSKK